MGLNGGQTFILILLVIVLGGFYLYTRKRY
ncbi:MAG: hypothetical protein UY52_C0014G0038 [Parcubacteria group bacterium GW2011_GWC2_49_9]|nr:MAG: hypothetical protein UY34_C0002G0003 [Parcubacteria group bacterium GW2011_GWA2_48_9]KKW15795.1 MAG: hypothetical protein UY52_C0014G0038 [Parcubacteria group bacterium GW2011_GWC2_49_9]